MTKKLGIIFAAIFIGMALLAWLFMMSTKPLPGVAQLQDGRDHKPEGTKIDYQFNPPTSGDHYASWITKGFYEESRPDPNLVHSMEHGYIIVWYDCTKKFSIFNFQFSINAYAQANMTQGSEGTPSAKLSDMPKAFSDGSCDQLKSDLKSLYRGNQHKLIIMPRVGMDSPIILTAWGRMEKLAFVDQAKIKEFINAFRDNGPEQTNEP